MSGSHKIKVTVTIYIGKGNYFNPRIPSPSTHFNKAEGSQGQNDLTRQFKKQERLNKSKHHMTGSLLSDFLLGENVVNSILRKLKIVLFKNGKPNVVVHTSDPSTQEVEVEESLVQIQSICLAGLKLTIQPRMSLNF